MYPPTWRLRACPPDPLLGIGVLVYVFILVCIVILLRAGYDLAGATASVTAAAIIAVNAVQRLVSLGRLQFGVE